MNNPSPTSVSVVIPCRDSARWLDCAVRSALADDCVREVIVVDDGSVDRSVEIARAFGPPVRVIATAPAGGNAARNTGLAAATGEWVQFLDADDYLQPGKIVRQLAEASAVSDFADVLYSPVIVESWRNGQVGAHEATSIDADADMFTRWITWQLPQTGGGLWRRSSLLALGGWRLDQPCCQEHELYLRALRAGLRFHHCPTPGAVYRVWSEDTVCRRDPVQVIIEKTKLIDNALEWLRAADRLGPVHLSAAKRAFFEMARTWAVHDLEAARRYYAERKERRLILPAGPAAPAAYRMTLSLLGFANAERIASLLR